MLRIVALFFLILVVVCQIRVTVNAEINDGLIAYYPFNGNANDESGNGNHGTVFGPTLTADNFGNPDSAYLFDGKDDYIELPATAFEDLYNESFTMSFMVRVDAPPTSDEPLPYSIVIDSNLLSLRIYYLNSAVDLFKQTFHISHFTYVPSTTPLQLGMFCHVVTIADAVERVTKLFINGSLAGKEPWQENQTSWYPWSLEPMSAYIGVDFFQDPENRSLNGVIDEIRIYNHTFTDEEIKAMYAESMQLEEKIISIARKKYWPHKIRGISLLDALYPGITLDNLVNELLSLGVNHVKMLKFNMMRNSYDNEFDPSLNPESDSFYISLIDKLQSAGISTSIMPFNAIHNALTGKPQPEDVQEWFDNYSVLLMNDAILAESTSCEYFMLFSDEIQHLTLYPELTVRWLELIKDVKNVYSGKLTSTIWTDGNFNPALLIPMEILQELDVIGLGFFPRYTDKKDPTIEELMNSYHRNAFGVDLVGFLESLHKSTGKNIFITDIAFRAFDGANMDDSVIYNPTIPKTLDEGEQRDQYEAFFQVMSRQEWDWFEGVIFASWDRYQSGESPSFPEFVAEYAGPLGERIKGKLAEGTVREWFNSDLNECLPIRNDLSLIIPCADYGGSKYGIRLNYYHDWHWGLDAGSIKTAEDRDGCLAFGTDLRLPISCAEYDDNIYGFTLNYSDDLTWQLDLSTIQLK